MSLQIAKKSNFKKLIKNWEIWALLCPQKNWTVVYKGWHNTAGTIENIPQGTYLQPRKWSKWTKKRLRTVT